MPMNLPPEVAQKFAEWDKRQIYNPVETEKVEGTLWLTQNRRIIPITQHYYSNFNAREQPNR